MLYLSNDDRNNPKFQTTAGFFGLDLTTDPVTTARALALQEIKNKLLALQTQMLVSPSRTNINDLVGTLWQEVVALVGEANGESVQQLDGELVAVSQSGQATVVPTNTQSRLRLRPKV